MNPKPMNPGNRWEEKTYGTSVHTGSALGPKASVGVKGRKRIEVSRNEPETYCEMTTAPEWRLGTMQWG